jgi:hypothetical protein
VSLGALENALSRTRHARERQHEAQRARFAAAAADPGCEAEAG